MKTTKKDIKLLLDGMGVAERKNRQRVANYFLTHQEDLPLLLEIVFETDYRLHHKAAWTLEFVLEKNLGWLVPHLDYFTENLHQLTHQSSIRPIAKICKWIANAFVKKQEHLFVQNLTPLHINQLVETGFDWMIGKHKVAAKAYTMATLYYFGKLPLKKLNWIHPELKNIILQNIQTGSPAYKSQGRKILRLI